ncbi:MAG: hypothetical protein ACE5I1_14540 [bacterium]
MLNSGILFRNFREGIEPLATLAGRLLIFQKTYSAAGTRCFMG